MSGPIKKGDLVMQVKPTPCCGNADNIGDVFVVTWIGVAIGRCHSCGDRTPENAASTVEDDSAVPLSMLKKIDPPATGEYDRVPVRKAQPKKVPA